MKTTKQWELNVAGTLLTGFIFIVSFILVDIDKAREGSIIFLIGTLGVVSGYANPKVILKEEEK